MTTSVTRSRLNPPALESKGAAPTQVAAQKVTQRPSGCFQKLQRYAADTFPLISWAVGYVYARIYPPKPKGPVAYIDMHLNRRDLTTDQAKKCYESVRSAYLKNRKHLDKKPHEITDLFWDKMRAI